MFSIDDTEKMIASVRAQADALEATAKAMRSSADSLEAAIAPAKLAMQAMGQVNAAQKMFSDFWTGKSLLTSMQKPDKLDIKV